MLGYSSIAQAGNFLVGLAAIAAYDPDGARCLGASGVVFFLATYAFTNLGAFFAVMAISRTTGATRSPTTRAWADARRCRRWCCRLPAVADGDLPPTAGFIAKIYIFNAAVQADLWWLALAGVVASVISAYYYLGVVTAMFTREPEAEATSFQPSLYLGAAVTIAVVGMFAIGVYPNPLIQASEHAAQIFG